MIRISLALFPVSWIIIISRSILGRSQASFMLLRPVFMLSYANGATFDPATVFKTTGKQSV